MGAVHTVLCDPYRDVHWMEVQEALPLYDQIPFGDAGTGPVVTDARLVYLDRSERSAKGEAEVARSMSSSSSRSGNVRYKPMTGMSIIRAAGVGAALASPPMAMDKVALAKFREKLVAHRIDLDQWGVDGTKTVDHLFWELYEQRGSILIGLDSPGQVLKRVTRIVKVKVTAEVFGVNHTLFSRMQFLHDRRAVERKQVPLRRLKWTTPQEELSADFSYADEKSQHTEDWRMGVKLCLEERLGLPEKWQKAFLIEEKNSYSYKTEDNVLSDGYPGINTMYCIHEATFRIRQPEHPDLICLGLPVGQEFATTEGDFNLDKQDQDFGLPIGTQLNIWAWMRDENPTKCNHSNERHGASPGKSPPASAPKATEAELRIMRRVPLPPTSAQEVASMQARVAMKESRPPSSPLWAALKGKTTNWDAARKIASKIHDPAYTLRQYFDDLHAFPELNLYLLEDGVVGDLSSGRSIGDEYQRTLGCFFAIYWLMRLHLDGKDGFCFGVDDDWIPHTESADENRLFPKDRRVTFLKKGKWDYFQKLLVDSGLLKEEHRGGGVVTGYQVVEERLVALLALTAIHDIMKMRLLLPEVQQDHAPYHGYKVADTIADHDHALGYVMDHFEDALPSFRDLGEVEKRAVKFTQCNLSFNHGWFVQAEAPPGAVFTKFREALIVDHKSTISQPDVALYFVHWLTDLAGAEPTPLGGCEKFVTKFPLPVLNSFLQSFEFIHAIAKRSETEVMENYLKTRWAEHQPSAGPVPTGESAIAKMRLLCMAQMNAMPVLRAFDELQEEEQQVLSVEMGRSGCMTQSYSQGVVPEEVRQAPVGPAFLVYYGPAYLQSLGNDDCVMRLCILAEVYRCARILWPANAARTDQTVTVRIDMIKALSTAEILQVMSEGDVWLMVRHNDSEAFIERSSKKKLNKMLTTAQPVQILDMTCLGKYH